MARSRYSNTRIIDGRNYGTFRLPQLSAGYRDFDILEGVRTFEYTYKVGDRLDHLAAKYLGDDGYWWVIALCNGIAYPFSSGGLTNGKRLRIPFDVQDVLDKVMR